jgi:glutathione S-transferase
MAAWRAYIDKFHALVEKTLAHHGKKFIAGDKLTIADFVMASHIGNYVKNPASPFQTEGSASAAPHVNLQRYMKDIYVALPYLTSRGAVAPF